MVTDSNMCYFRTGYTETNNIPVHLRLCLICPTDFSHLPLLAPTRACWRHRRCKVPKSSLCPLSLLFFFFCSFIRAWIWALASYLFSPSTTHTARDPSFTCHAIEAEGIIQSGEKQTQSSNTSGKYTTFWCTNQWKDFYCTSCSWK